MVVCFTPPVLRGSHQQKIKKMKSGGRCGRVSEVTLGVQQAERDSSAAGHAPPPAMGQAVLGGSESDQSNPSCAWEGS